MESNESVVGDVSTSAEPHTTSNLLSFVAIVQAFFYVVTGVWPLISMSTFEAITGPKTDDWLVKTVGVLVTVIGLVLAMAALRRRITLEVMALAVGSAIALAGVDVVYAFQRRISAVYLLDALAELILAALWIAAWIHSRREVRRETREPASMPTNPSGRLVPGGGL